MLVNKKGKPVTINNQLPIYWLRKVAAVEAMKFKCYVSRVEITHIDKF